MLTFSDKLPRTSRWYLIMGNPKNGKSVTACTASDFAPEEITAATEATDRTYLSDTLTIQFDTDGHQGPRSCGLVPYVFDLSLATEYRDLVKGLGEAVQAAAVAVKVNGIKYVIIDTVTTLDIMLTTQLKKLHEGQQLYGALLKHHMDFCLGLKALPVTVIVLSHLRYNHPLLEAQEMKDQARKRASSLPGQIDYSMDLTGKSAAYYKGAVSGVFVVYKKLAPKNSDDPPEYRLITDNMNGYEAGNRFGLTEEEPAHLRKLFKKIELKQRGS